jgi:hypothetical protein
MIVNGSGYVINAFRDMIAAGKYDYLYGFAEKPEEIKGQTWHDVARYHQRDRTLDHPAKRLTTKQVYEKYGDKMASLSELLAYGINNPDTQRSFPIGIVWKDGDQFWYAYLDSFGSERMLCVDQVRPSDEWNGSCRFLVHK